MRIRVLISIILGFSLILVSSGLAQKKAEQLFQSALYEEEVTGELEKAIALYSKVLEAAKDESLAAKAQLQIGICYEKLGKTEAIKAYEIVLEKYSGQKEQAAVARARLAELKKEEPKGLSVTELNFYIPDFFIEPFDLSPDGTKMLGVQIGKGQNIVVRDLENQNVKFITEFDWGEASHWTYNPVWSPDGKKIVYYAYCWKKGGSCGKSLRVSTLDGKTRVLLSSDEYWFFPNAWMPDGSSILTIRGVSNNPQELGLVPSEGGEFKKLTSLKGYPGSGGKSNPCACISPDGRFIAFEDIAPGEESDIFVISSDGKKSWPLLKHPARDTEPRWSPDGKHVVFLSLRHGSWALWGVAVENGKAVGDPFIIREGMKDASLLNWTSNGLACGNWITIRDIYLMDVDPKTGEPVGKPRQLEYTPTGGNHLPVWSPDGKYLAFLREDDTLNRFYINVLSADGSSSREFPVPRGHSRGYLRWMPDGKGIGMNTRNEKRENIILSLRFNTEKWEEIAIPVNRWTRFEWSGSGRAFLYSKIGHADMGAGIYERDLKTGEERLIYRPKGRVNFRALKCSRDYKWLAFLESNRKIVVVNLETGKSHLAASDVGFPSWSPDGQKIMAMRAYGGSKEHYKSLFVLPASGGPVKEFDLSQSLPKDSRIQTPDWSPDGKQVVLSFRQTKSDVLLYKNVIPKEK